MLTCLRPASTQIGKAELKISQTHSREVLSASDRWHECAAEPLLRRTSSHCGSAAHCC
jgi:hypothetical protein